MQIAHLTKDKLHQMHTKATTYNYEDDHDDDHTGDDMSSFLMTATKIPSNSFQCNNG